MEKLTIKCEKQEKLYDILRKNGITYNQYQKALRNKDIKINGKRIKSDSIVLEGDEITIYYEKVNHEIEIIYQDENVIIANKPIGIEVEGKDGLAEKLNALAVHRLDRNTTGLIILAKDAESRGILTDAIKARAITKKYMAYVVGETHFNGEYKAYLVKDAQKSVVKIYNTPQKNSVQIISIFKTIKNEGDKSLVECTLVTGKTHQLRAHLAYLGHPIIGDGKYGKNEDNKKFGEKYQLLHCFYIKFDKIQGKLNYLEGGIFVKNPEFIIQ